MLLLALLLPLLPGLALAAPAPPLKVGAAIADVTGPAAAINFMGSAMMGQVGRGLHFRLRARAFVFQEVRVLFRGRCARPCVLNSPIFFSFVVPFDDPGSRGVPAGMYAMW